MATKKPIILFGATSFVGKLLCEYLIKEYDLKSQPWVIAGRSENKLNKLKESLGEKAKDLQIIVANADDETTLRSMCEQAKVVISTVGPYALYGEPLVKVCAESGTDYCDLTGETQWIKQMVDKYHALAQKSGARIVNCCGFDSIPSDLGVLFLQEKAKEEFGEYCFRVKMRVKAMAGGASGGTVASMLNIVKEASQNPALRRELANPYTLCPDGHPFFAHQAANNSAKYDEEFGKWIGPFVMATINTRIVHRSNALSGVPYGNNFLYDEAMLMKNRWMASALTGGLGAFMVGAAIPPTRILMEKLFLPSPGEGPSPKEQEEGFFDLRFVGETALGKKVKCKVTGDRDPGYGSTAKVLSETAIFMATKLHAKKKGGFWTPASLLGMPLVERLQEKAGLSFELLE